MNTTKLNPSTGIGFVISWLYTPLFLTLIGGGGYASILMDISPIARLVGLFGLVECVLRLYFSAERTLPCNYEWNLKIGDRNWDRALLS